MFTKRLSVNAFKHIILKIKYLLQDINTKGSNIKQKQNISAISQIKLNHKICATPHGTQTILILYLHFIDK